MSQDDRFLNDVDDVEPVLPEPQVTPLPVATPIVSDTTPMAPVSTPPAIRPDYYRAFPNEVDPIEGQGEPGQQKIDKERREILQQGSYDGFVGRVLKIYTGGTHPTLGMEQGIDVERVDVRWDTTTNKPLSSVTPSPKVGSNNIVACKPWPGTHDQEAYQVEVGDTVLVIRGEDDLYWYTYHNDLFVGRVVAWDDTEVTEDFIGGADSTNGLKVRQQAITGNPLGSTATLGDLETIADAWVTAVTYLIDDVAQRSDVTYRCIKEHDSQQPPNATYWEVDNIVIKRYVNIIKGDNQAHGYRVGDYVLVFRRGSYLFCSPLRDSFLGKLNTGAGSGPDGEADFADEHYWVREVSPDVTTSTNSWAFVGTNFTSSTDPTGSGGIKGRWVDAVNLAERTDETHILADGTLVEVQMWQDADEDPYYTFTQLPFVEELPDFAGEDQYKVLQLNGTPEPIWDWVRAHG
jgi:hypothetical protein